MESALNSIWCTQIFISMDDEKGSAVAGCSSPVGCDWNKSDSQFIFCLQTRSKCSFLMSPYFWWMKLLKIEKFSILKLHFIPDLSWQSGSKSTQKWSTDLRRLHWRLASNILREPGGWLIWVADDKQIKVGAPSTTRWPGNLLRFSCFTTSAGNWST